MIFPGPYTKVLEQADKSKIVEDETLMSESRYKAPPAEAVMAC
jgi:hypothetical protein